MIAIIGLVIGVVIGVVLQPDVPVALQPYLPIAVVAALDTLAGGLRATLDGAFDSHVFITSFLFNVLLASFLVFLGDQLGVGAQLSTADRKSTRLNSSHVAISYAVFCLKKNNKPHRQ